MSPLDEAAAAFARDNPEEAPPPPAPTPNERGPGSRAEPQPSSPAAPEQPRQVDEDDDEDEFATPEQAAAFAIGMLDMALTNFVGSRMELTPKQERKLVRLATPLVRKYMPTDVGELVSPEVAFLGGALMVYAPKYLSPEPEQTPASPPGGSESESGSSGGPSTAANIDGKNVAAEVLHFKKGAPPS